MDVKQLQELVKRYEENKDFITNEETTKMALVVPFIRALGYDPNSPREVRLEFAAEFTQGDGKRLQDRMDFAIFDKTGSKPLMVIEAKPLGSDLSVKSPQLARYIAQMPDLRFGILTDGCRFDFFGDLESPNRMDKEPFFHFSLDDEKIEWAVVARELTKFSREEFNADTLVTEAENSRYRLAMIDRIVTALQNPADDESFLKWLTGETYSGKRTSAVMTRLGIIAKETIKPAIIRVMSDEFIEELRTNMQRSIQGTEEKIDSSMVSQPAPDQKTATTQAPARKGVETTDEEIDFYRTVVEILKKDGVPAHEILYKDTTNYFNVSFMKPTRWFLRYFGDSRRKSIVTLVPTDEVKSMCQGFEVEVAPSTFGVSRVYLDDPGQVASLESLVLRSFRFLEEKGAVISEEEAN